MSRLDAHQARRSTYCRHTSAPGPNQILHGDATTQLRRLPSNTVDLLLSSPPYLLLHDYGVDGQLGLEPTVEQWVENLVAVMDEVARVLKPSGSAWLNVGDSYSRAPRFGAPAKGLLLAPERLLLALADRGWIVRNRVAWSKPNPMPASVGDRLTNSWEPLYFLVRSAIGYYFDLDPIRLPLTSDRRCDRPAKVARTVKSRPTWSGPYGGKNDGLLRARAEGRPGHPLGRNPGDHWSVATAGYRGAHFAVFPEKLIERPILAACPERVCLECGVPWQRERHRDRLGDLRQVCSCRAGWQPGLVLDPFLGSGTTAVVAERLNRRWLGVELNETFVDLAHDRIQTARGSPTSQPRHIKKRKEHTNEQ